jgi:protein-L-isoaspartate(D-aspartate) O-methyltransferase
VTPEELRGRLADQLDELDSTWRAAYDAVPRHLFAPARGWIKPDGVEETDGYPVDRDVDPAAWWEAVYSDSAVITQIDDGEGDPVTGQGSYTSSMSSPGAVFSSLRHLYPHDGHRVLEVGTGTGWTAGLLSARLGAACVTSIEVDPAVAEQAAKNLSGAGYQPHLVVGDGGDGWPDGAPYDRVHVTCGVRTVPWSWVWQTRPGGVIVAPWNPGWIYGHLLRLVVGHDHAVGRLVTSAGYMMMRSQRHPRPRRDGTRPEQSTTSLDPRTILWDGYGADIAITALVPGVVSRSSSENGRLELRMWDGEGSWASTAYEPGCRDYEVLTHGPRRLWDEVADAYLTWVGWGRPDRGRFGITVTPKDQQVWLDFPDKVISRQSPQWMRV